MQSAGRRQKKKSRRGADIFSCAYETATLIFRAAVSLHVDFSLFRPLEFFVDPKNGDGRNNNPPAMRVRVDCYTKKLPFRVQ